MNVNDIKVIESEVEVKTFEQLLEVVMAIKNEVSTLRVDVDKLIENSQITKVRLISNNEGGCCGRTA